MAVNDKEVVLISCTSLILGCAISLSNSNRKKRRSRKIWMKDWLRERDKKGAYANILQELRLNDRENFRKYLRMNTETFQETFFSYQMIKC